ncbi:MAG: non-ribosomal peptide synthetase, partial [Vicinamibacteria bacterium]
VAQLTAVSFDAILRDVFLPLTSGACLVIPEAAMDLGADRVLPWLSREKVTVLHGVPTLLESWLASAPEGMRAEHLRWVLFSGESLTFELARKCRTGMGARGVVNLYGPTETTMTKCFYVVPDDCPEEGLVPAGEAMPQTQALVLREDGVRCGIGEAGEIAIRTPYRTRGYVNGDQDDKTRFRPNPYRNDRDDLLYYTGDLGRCRANGSLEFLGRKDSQLKVQGARVEPSEVEQCLSLHPSVAQSAVVGQRTKSGMSLVAYAVARPGAVVELRELKRHLRERLPEYMVPQSIVALESLPLTASGKLDRKALSSIRGSAKEAAMRPSPVLPRTPLEQVIAGIWCEVLDRSEISVEDDFFDLGGHSLLATQLVSRIRSAFRCDLPLREFFENPSVAGLARSLTADPEAFPRVVRTAEILLEIAHLSDDAAESLLAERAEGKPR